MSIIPITILTGFLGSGKTTLLNRIIAENKDKKFAVMVNDFGEVNIDSDLIKQELHSDEQIYQFTNGCICCVVREDLIKALENLLSKNNDIDYIIIETSGLADPIPVIQTFEIYDINGKVYLDSVITLVDGLNYFENNKNHEISLKQIFAADIIVLNKAQEITQLEIDNICQDIKKKNPEAYILVNKNDIDTKLLIESGEWSYEKIMRNNYLTQENNKHKDKITPDHVLCTNCKENSSDHSCSHHGHSHNHDKDHSHEHYDEYLYLSSTPLNLEKFNEWIVNDIPKDIIRAKGFIKTKNFIFENFIFQMVGSRKQLLPFNPPKDKFDPNTTKIVFIGKKIDKEKLKQDLESLLIT